MGYYITRSAIFHDLTNVYEIDLFAQTVQQAGGRNITASNLNGQRNQPLVVTFDVLSDVTRSNIQVYLDRLPVFKRWGCLIEEKDW